jgi:hypothetical protein
MKQAVAAAEVGTVVPYPEAVRKEWQFAGVE